MKNGWVIITGANGGIGQEVLKIFAKNKNNILAITRSKDESFQDKINSLKLKEKISVEVLSCDFLDKDQVKNTSIEIIKNYEISSLINNAGRNFISLYQMTNEKNMKEIFEINFFSHYFFTQNIIKNMIKNKRGSIVNISSSAATDCPIGSSAYSASKSAMISWTKVLSKELSRFNIRVNAISPGLTNTKMMNDYMTDLQIKNYINNLSIKRPAEPEEIAETIFFLCTDKSKYINGQVIRVDGGI